MSNNFTIKKGFDINLAGEASPTVVETEHADTFAIKPDDFHGISLAKPLVKEGENVMAGTPLFYDKRDERIHFVAPVSGEIVEVKRGNKRKLVEIKILADREITYLNYDKYTVSGIATISAQEARNIMLKAGVWNNIIQRPFGIIADPDITPKAIHISTFDTHPLAPDYAILFNGQTQFFNVGIRILKKITSGIVHMNIRAGEEISSFFSQAEMITINKFSGPHPAGCVGVQIHHIDAINKNDTVWTVNPFGVIQIGKLFLNGHYDASRIVSLVGSEVKNPQYYKTYTGSSIQKIVKENLKSEKVRFISGNVLTGTDIGSTGHIGYFDHCVTVIPEEDEYSFFGWIAPSLKKLSFHRAIGLFSYLRYRSNFTVGTNTHGEPRTFVQTGAFERVVPMDILPVYLLKSILAGDIDEMEELGIYEVIEEDLALCEFIDVSKHPVQKILREGIELLQNS